MSSALPPWLQPAWRRFQSAVHEDRLGHGLLVCGEQGLGKRSLVAAIVARLACQSPGANGDACGVCQGCIWRIAGTHPDLTHVVPEEDSTVIKVDQIRGLIARAQLTGRASATRVIVVDPADSMNNAAQNALLKTLEEPAPGIHVILVADAPSRLLPTLRSRCQVLTIAAPDEAMTAGWLAVEGIAVPAEMLALAASHPGRARAMADAAMRSRALSVADDLRRMRSGDSSALAIARRWSEDAAAHLDDAIAWLRLWAWQSKDLQLPTTKPPPDVSSIALSQSYATALLVRERLRAPLKAHWLLHEWLVGWEMAGR